MKRFWLVLFLLLLPAFAHADEKSAYDRVIAKNEIVCGVMPWAPYVELNPNTKHWSGFAVELFSKAFSTLDLKITFKEVVLGNQIQDLNNGRIDAICNDGPYTMSAGKFVEYSEPAYFSVVYPYVRKDDARFKSRADLNAKDVRFIGIDGDVSSDLAQRLFPKAAYASMPGTTDVSQLFLNVKTGKVDVAIVDPTSFSAYNKNNPDTLKPLFKDKPLGTYKIVISVKKGDLKMLGLVNQAIDNALAFGLVDEALDKFDPKHELLMRVRSRATY